MTGQQTSGADLARMALAAARANVKTNPAPAAKKTRRNARPARGEGRDPQGLGNILGRLTAEQGWNDNLGGGNILDRWTDLCPTAYTHTTRPTAFDADTGQLTVKATSHTVAAHLRIMERQLVGYINQQIGRPLVRRVRVGISGNTTPAAPTVEEQPAPDALVKTRETASAGYRATLEAALAHRPDRAPSDPYVIEALARQEAALRTNRQPENEHRDAVWEIDRLTTNQPDPTEATRRAAIARARNERAGSEVPRRLFGAA